MSSATAIAAVRARRVNWRWEGVSTCSEGTPAASRSSYRGALRGESSMERSISRHSFIAGVRGAAVAAGALLPRDQGVPDRQEGLVVVVERFLAQGGDLVGVPVALEV